MPALLFALYLVVEITALVVVGHLIGALATILLLIAGSGLGLILVRSQGRRVFDQFRRAGRGEIAPGTALADGALVGMGAVLMFVPGLVTSLLGLLLLLPTRALLRPLLTTLAARRIDRLSMATGYHGVVVDPSGDVVDGVVVHQYYDDGQGPARRMLDDR
ncbi:FxsA family protein [Nocardia transvalensis]|uniref:FxsA family protein n=1 Tax=Nocardia transvalensis TaxID=37333 RepID=UPI0018955E67|nr:FxsA family protein [Nocardia transvalensis]MBF6331423.1 FxsA family protein [Nocardia transvalensis]